ncbi:MAG: hypothetical protein U0W40_17480 [Acidimicrobiia bacterium]
MARRADRYKEAVDLACEHIRERATNLKIALEPKPQRAPGRHVPADGRARARVSSTSLHFEMVGLNLEVVHETASGLQPFTHAGGGRQTMWHGQALLHIDLNAQRIGKYDQDFRLVSRASADALPGSAARGLRLGGGMRHFDAHPYRTEDAAGVWEFASGRTRTYLILKEKADACARREIQDALQVAQAGRIDEPTGVGGRARRHVRRGCTRCTGLRPRAPRRLLTELLLGVR